MVLHDLDRGETGKICKMVSQIEIFRCLVKDYMGAAPVRVSLETTCHEVVRLLEQHAASSAVVENEESHAVGIITEQDICRRVAFRVEPTTPAKNAMSSPLKAVRDSDYLFHALASMRRSKLRHMPVLDSSRKVVGVLHQHEALAVAASQMVRQIERLTHVENLSGMKNTKQAQVEVASELFIDSVPAAEIQVLITHINNDLYKRVIDLCLREMCTDGFGTPPVAFDVIVMGSGGRGESFLHPDQDNGFILADYPDSEHDQIDLWFIELAGRMTEALNEVGFEFCPGYVMATNPLWRKTISQWCKQVSGWVGKGSGTVLRLADIFFDFVCVHGDGFLSQQLRDHVAATAKRPYFLREMFKVDEEHGVALGLFGHLQRDPLPGPNHGKVNLKLTGTLPLVGAVRLFALREGVTGTSTLTRLDSLHRAGILHDDEHDYLCGAFRHITDLLLRQQLSDYQAGKSLGNHVPPEALSKRDKDMLVDSFKAIRKFRSRVRAELSGEIF